MTSLNGRPISDSVNLGSNPSSPATRNADVSGISRDPGRSPQSELAEQTAHTGRTEVGTALAQFSRDLAAAQVPLGEPFASILAEHAWELYATDQPSPSGSRT